MRPATIAIGIIAFVLTMAITMFACTAVTQEFVQPWPPLINFSIGLFLGHIFVGWASWRTRKR